MPILFDKICEKCGERYSISHFCTNFLNPKKLSDREKGVIDGFNSSGGIEHSDCGGQKDELCFTCGRY